MLAPNVENIPDITTSAFPRAAARDCEQRSGDRSRADDAALIREAQQGNLKAFEELVRYYDKVVLRLAFHLTGSEQDAQDVCQEAFLNAYRNLSRFRFECSFYTWIYRIVTNQCLDCLRRRRSRASVSREESGVLSNLPDHRPAHNPERGLAARELRTRIARALEKLSPRERTVFHLRHHREMKLRSVAAMLNTSEGNARHILFRATQKLRVALAELR
ncbi:MAG TPA: RNA polymerase sigma factor [Terriglobia bacterium]|nr:RNA polymerase sigma factor [Terriglobia bacterium]